MLLGQSVLGPPRIRRVRSDGDLLGLTPEKIAAADLAVLTEYGHLAETFAIGEILKLLSACDSPVTVGHFRTNTGDEVDLIVETTDGRVLAFAVKAGSRVHGEDLKGIRALRSKLGHRLTAVVLYTGAHAFQHEEGSYVLPLDSLWRP